MRAMRGAGGRLSPSGWGMASLPTGLSSCLVPWLSCQPKKARKRMPRSSVGGTLNERSSMLAVQRAPGERHGSGAAGATVVSWGGRDMFARCDRNAKQVRSAGLGKEKVRGREAPVESMESRPAILARRARGPALRPGNQPGSDDDRVQRQHGHCSQTGGVPGSTDGGPTSSSRSLHASPGEQGPSELCVTATSLHLIPSLFPTTAASGRNTTHAKLGCLGYQRTRAALRHLLRANVWFQRARPRWRRTSERPIRGRRLALYGTHTKHSDP
jgi:hypothetical protein